MGGGVAALEVVLVELEVGTLPVAGGILAEAPEPVDPAPVDPPLDCEKAGCDSAKTAAANAMTGTQIRGDILPSDLAQLWHRNGA